MRRRARWREGEGKKGGGGGGGERREMSKFIGNRPDGDSGIRQAGPMLTQARRCSTVKSVEVCTA